MPSTWEHSKRPWEIQGRYRGGIGEVKGRYRVAQHVGELEEAVDEGLVPAARVRRLEGFVGRAVEGDRQLVALAVDLVWSEG